MNAWYGFTEFMQYEEKALNLDGILRTIQSPMLSIEPRNTIFHFRHIGYEVLWKKTRLLPIIWNQNQRV